MLEGDISDFEMEEHEKLLQDPKEIEGGEEGDGETRNQQPQEGHHRVWIDSVPLQKRRSSNKNLKVITFADEIGTYKTEATIRARPSTRVEVSVKLMNILNILFRNLMEALNLLLNKHHYRYLK